MITGSGLSVLVTVMFVLLIIGCGSKIVVFIVKFLLWNAWLVSFWNVTFTLLLIEILFVTLVGIKLMLMMKFVPWVRLPSIHVLFVPVSGSGCDVR